jgi:ABC-type dipeptide/oligopeptide/nickel transport system permease subunit
MTAPSGAFHALWARPRVRASLVVVAAYLLVAAAGFAQLLPAHEAPVGAPLQPPSWHWATLLGTDVLGRSVLWRVLAGAQTAVAIGLASTALAVPAGTLLGLLAGWFGGWVDALVDGLYSVVQAVPDILLITAVSYAMGRGLAAMCCAVAATSWVGVMRLVRAEVLRQRGSDYVLAARGLGAGAGRLMFAEILPNVLHVVVATASLVAVMAVKSEVILTYLGLGMQDGASWGLLIAGAVQDLVDGAWAPLAGTVAAMFGLILSVATIGDALRDALDPRVPD